MNRLTALAGEIRPEFPADWLRATAWPMDMPRPYSAFHIAVCGLGVVFAFWLARLLAVKLPNRRKKTSACGRSDPASCRILFLCGVLLAAGEVYKQLFLYFVVYGTYNWWYFPFQLCSIPMYLCLLLPVLCRQETLFRTVCTFLQDFGLLGGVMALAEPSGLLHPYWTLTMHGLLWHIMLIFIGLFLAFSQIPFRTPGGYLRTLPMLGAFCLIATAINVSTGGAADMFYISPYYPVTQVVFHELSLRLGTGAGILIYMLSLCIGGFLFHMLAARLCPHKPAEPR